MFEQVKYIQNSFNITFPRQSDIRRKLNDLEDELKKTGHYSAPQVISVPDDLDPEIPRVIFGSTHGYSQIVISQINIILNVSYSPDWQLNINNGKQYLLERIEILFKLIDILKLKPYFCGFTTLVNLPEDLDDSMILNHLSKSFIKNVEKNTFDTQLKTTNIALDCFFNNIIIQNYRLWNVIEQGIPRLSYKDAFERGIQIISDFNDRYAFNERKDYVSNIEIAKEIINKGLYSIDEIIKKVQGQI